MSAKPIAIFVLLLAMSCLCVAQQEPCGLRTITETVVPTYPPIALAAHEEGIVTMLVNFKTSGEVEKIEVITGSKFLQLAATTYVQGWRANEYTGPRTCPIVIRFVMFHQGDKPVPRIVRQDPQHVTINSLAPLIQP
jgi:hypothetical protein